MPPIVRIFATTIAVTVWSCAALAQTAGEATWDNDNPPANASAEWQEPGSASPSRLPVRFQRAERSATHEESDPTNAPTRLPPRNKSIPLAPFSENERPGAPPTGEVPSFVTGAASLGIVLGLFLLVVWVVRRGMPKSASLLPSEAVEMLGRAPLFGKTQVHLLRCGNKILLVCASPSSVETLTEITDPQEVERLTELCQPGPGGATTSFRQTFQQFGNEARGLDYLVQEGAEELDFTHLEVAPRRRTQESRA